MKNVLIIVRNKAMYADLEKYLQENGTEVTVCHYNDLGFLIDNEKTCVVDRASGKDLKEFDKVLVLSTPKGHGEMYMFSALACYCKKNQIPLFDDEFSSKSGKLYAMWKLWEDGVSVPKTAFGPVEFMAEQLENFGGIGVLKAVHGTKGTNNYLVHSADEIKNILQQNSEIRFILQNFVPNDGDFRIVTIDFEPKLAIFRHRAGDSNEHRNNTSVGGESEVVELAEVDPKLLQVAAKAAKSLNIKIAGVDVLMDKETGEYYILEVNRNPQLVTGSSLERKFEVLRELAQS